jgi:hypothetical protein
VYDDDRDVDVIVVIADAAVATSVPPRISDAVDPRIEYASYPS